MVVEWRTGSDVAATNRVVPGSWICSGIQCGAGGFEKHIRENRAILSSSRSGVSKNSFSKAAPSGKDIREIRRRFVEGLTRDKTRPSRIPPLPPETVDRVIALTNQAPPHEATHWTAPAMAKAVGISPSSVRRMWKGHGLQPHRVRAFKISNDPRSADKLKDVVGLYVDPPAHAVVLSIDPPRPRRAAREPEPFGIAERPEHLGSGFDL